MARELCPKKEMGLEFQISQKRRWDCQFQTEGVWLLPSRHQVIFHFCAWNSLILLLDLLFIYLISFCRFQRKGKYILWTKEMPRTGILLQLRMWKNASSPKTGRRQNLWDTLGGNSIFIPEIRFWNLNFVIRRVLRKGCLLATFKKLFTKWSGDTIRNKEVGENKGAVTLDGEVWRKNNQYATKIVIVCITHAYFHN